MFRVEGSGVLVCRIEGSGVKAFRVEGSEVRYWGLRDMGFCF